MLKFPIHTVATAPERSKPILEQTAKSVGFVPNLHGMLAESPALLKGYTTLSAIFDQTSLTPTERQIVLLTVSAENGCAYCMAAHTTIARMQGVAEDVVGALRQGTGIPEAKLDALREFPLQVVRRRGWATEKTLLDFLDAGYTTAHVLDVVLGVGLKTLSNYANHMACTPLDAAFEFNAWSSATPQAAASTK